MNLVLRSAASEKRSAFPSRVFAHFVHHLRTYLHTHYVLSIVERQLALSKLGFSRSVDAINKFPRLQLRQFGLGNRMGRSGRLGSPQFT